MFPRAGIPQQRSRVVISGIGFDPVREDDVLRHVMRELGAGRGGQIITPNVDILRRVKRDAESRRHVDAATHRGGRRHPADLGQPPRRPATARAGTRLRPDLEPLGGARRTGAVGLPARRKTGHRRTGRRRCCGDVFRSCASPVTSARRSVSTPGPRNSTASATRSRAARPDLVYVGLGFPKQERVIARLRPMLRTSWFLGCGAAIGFVAGVHRRAPRWMQQTGLEWMHRLLAEPQRLGRRYVVHDIPFACRLLAGCGAYPAPRSGAAHARHAAAVGAPARDDLAERGGPDDRGDPADRGYLDGRCGGAGRRGGGAGAGPPRRRPEHAVDAREQRWRSPSPAGPDGPARARRASSSRPAAGQYAPRLPSTAPTVFHRMLMSAASDQFST